MVKRKIILSSESVTEGHPDKMCDIISDSILDEALRQDKYSRVAVESATKNGGVMVFGEMTTKAYVDIPRVVRAAIKDIGYTNSQYGIESETCSVWVQITEQSPDISQGVSEGHGLYKEQGAGDQGMMYGYASNETKELMPLPISLAHKLTKKLSDTRKDGEIVYLRPDGKSQVSIEYDEKGKPIRADTILVSTQHDSGTSHERIKKDIVEKVIQPVCNKWVDKDTVFHVNPTGAFVRGGPYADAGLTGRKIIVDTYGGVGRHGGGAFSGKDPTKVDRSAAYACRYIAKNIVAAKLADKCEVQLAYAIGVSKPVSINIDCFGTNKISVDTIHSLVEDFFPLIPGKIIEHFDLLRPIFTKTAAYGHFGRNNPDFTWEKTDKASLLRKEAGLK
ncbi:MAG: methionine adenosyltransferase [Candidatus Thermoplasmatota archaeon]|nr:methionine adenosyltransferase [Candidatus Thermoplasmatota archaeon]MBS3801158.1 methionine adenosyltransferase [Candidatus Thermoplasmatota archaeon]